MTGYWNAPGADGRDDPRRLALHRRHGPPRRRRLPDDPRPQEGPDHPRRLQRLPARRRGGAASSIPAVATACVRRPARTTCTARRSSPSSRCRDEADRRGARRLRQGAPRRVQVSARDPRARRAAADAGRQGRPEGAARAADRRKEERRDDDDADDRRARAVGRARARHELVARDHAGAGRTSSPTRPATTSGSTSIPSARRTARSAAPVAHGYLTLAMLPMLLARSSR